MVSQKAGRPAKPEQKKRLQLHISLYAEDLERLELLTDNRSEFLRQCIHRAWEEQAHDEATMSITLPKSVVLELQKIVEQLKPRNQVTAYRTLAARLKE